MRTISYSRLTTLSKTEGPGLVSLYLPTHRFGPEVGGDAILLRNLLDEAESLIAARGLDRGEGRRRLEPVRELVNDVEFWRHQGNGLAIFVGTDKVARYRLPESVEALAYVGDRFCVRPLLPSVGRGQVFFVLALSQNSVRLLSCTRTGARELDLHDIPQSLADAVGYDWEERSLQFHTGAPATGGGKRAAVFHGQGMGSDESKAELERFLRRVDRGLCDMLKDRTAPLVVAAVEYVIAMYRQVSHYPGLVGEGVVGNPEHLNVDELRQRAVEMALPTLDSDRRASLERLQELAGTDRCMVGLEDSLAAARDARAETLIVRSKGPAWGVLNEQGGVAEMHDQRRAGDDDLLDVAIAHGLDTGAEIFPADEDEIPEGNVIAALLRF